MEAIRKLTDPPRWPPATDDELSQYAADCEAVDVSKCNSCFAGPAMAQCASFLCTKDVGKLLARVDRLRAERDEFEEKWREVSRDLAALREHLERMTGGG